MSYRYLAFPVLFLVILSVLLAGCASVPVRLSDTHNITVAVQSYNTWTVTQKAYNQQAKVAIGQIGEHIAEYNSEIAKGSPDISTMRANVASDKQLLDQWAGQEAVLDTATEAFDSDTSALDYHSSDAKQAAGLLVQDMKIYAVDMKNTQQHLVEYTNFMTAFLAPDDPDYWNDAYRISAMKAGSDAGTSAADGDSALSAIMLAGQKLGSLQ